MRKPDHVPVVPPERQAGFSLLELTLVVLILGIMAAVMIPDSSPSDQHKLDLAAEQVAQALRFAHAEALRTGEHHGVTISQVTQKITVKKWDVSTNPVSTELIPYHPVDKKVFEFKADELTLANGVRITNGSDIFLYDGIGRRRSLIFAPDGMPVWILASGPTTHRLLEGVIELGLGPNQRKVVVASLTGRVTVQ